MIRNVVVDFGNVLVKWDVDAILGKYTFDKEDAETLKTVIFESKEWLQMDEGTLSAVQAVGIFEDRVPERLKGKAAELMRTWFEKVEFNQKVCELIKNLKQAGVRVYGLSNTNLQFYEYVQKSDVGSQFDGFVISAVEHLMKPDEKIYERLFETFSLNPEECFFVDDTEENIAAGRRCGMDGFVFAPDRFGELEEKLRRTKCFPTRSHRSTTSTPKF